MNLDKQKAITKWRPIIENLKIFNKQFKELMSYYAEWHIDRENKININSGGSYDSSLPMKFKEISDKIKKLEHIEVVGKYFNIGKGCIEYKLSNGNFVSKLDINNKEVEYELITFDELTNIFPLDFLNFIYPIETRDFKLNNILE